MPKCEICNKNVKTTFKCNECGSGFCEKCGEKDRLLCEDCADYEEQSKGSYKVAQDIEIGDSD